MAIFAVMDAREETAWSHPFRYLSDDQYPFKDVELAKAHKFGSWGIVVLCSMLGFINLVHESWIGAIEAGVAAVLTYWAVFDPSYALAIGEDWDYLGKFPKTDRWLAGVLGKNAGKIKAIACVSVLVFIVVFHFFIHK